MAGVFRFENDEFAGKTIRVTNETPRRVSVLDVIGIACGFSHPSQSGECYERILEDYPVCTTVDIHTSETDLPDVNFKFPGQQNRTPVAGARELMWIVMLLPGRKAMRFRGVCAKALVRYLGCDETLIDEIKVFKTAADAAWTRGSLPMWNDWNRVQEEARRDTSTPVPSHP